MFESPVPDLGTGLFFDINIQCFTLSHEFVSKHMISITNLSYWVKQQYW